jgi:dTDP-glucose 4,6-dehydratase
MIPRRVLITGVGGSIGCHVLRHLLKHTDWDVIGVDSFRHKGLTDRVHRVTYKHPESLPRLSVFTHDLMAPISTLLQKKMGPVDYIINLASISDVDWSLEDPGYVIRNNVELMVNVLDFARRAQPDVFLHVSTDEVYGPTDGKTTHKEWDPILPSNAYSASKAAQEAIGIAYWRSYGVPLLIVNIM